MARGRTRDAYAAVGAATRAAVELAMPGLTLPEARVLLALVARLTSWSLLSDRVAMRQLAEATAMDERAVRRAVKSLAERGAIVRSSGGSTPAAGRLASRFELPTPGPVTPGSVDPGSGEPGSGEDPTPGQADPSTPGRGDHLHEDYPTRTFVREDEVTPQPPAQRGANGRSGRRANGTNPRARAATDEVAAQRAATDEAERLTRTAAETGEFRLPPPTVLADARERLARPRAERPA